MNNWMAAVLKRPTFTLPSDGTAAWHRLRWAMRRGLRQLGLPGVVGLGVLAMCPAFYFSAIQPAQTRLETAHRNSLSVGERIKQRAALPEAERLTQAEQLASFYRIFPGEKSSPRWIEKLVVLAESHGLSLDQGDYKVARDKVGKLVQLKMTFPIKGEYTQIRKFVSALPLEIPVFSLESIQFERQKISDTAIEAKIGLVLYLGQES
ncbi:MAG: hypothetical protein KGZ83_01695 [Sulfuricella sp.]|nr:hypothetical protein [Sulfuricella sp.]